MLYRTAAARSLFRAAASSNASVARSALTSTVFKAQLTSSARQSPLTHPTTLALAARKPVSTALVRYASTAKSVETSPVGDADVDMMAGVKNDIVRLYCVLRVTRHFA